MTRCGARSGQRTAALTRSRAQLLRVLQAVHDANRQCHDSLRLLVAAPEGALPVPIAVATTDAAGYCGSETRGGERHDPDMFQAAVSRQHEGAVEQV